MPQSLLSALLNANMHSTGDAATALRDGWSVHRTSEAGGVVTEMTVKTFELRAAHVKKLDGAHWQQLAASTEEFARNLAGCIGTPVECITISGPSEYEYVMFYCAERERVIGCMKVRPSTEPLGHIGGATAA